MEYFWFHPQDSSKDHQGSVLTRDKLDLILKNQPKSTTSPLENHDIENYKVLLKQALCIQDPAVRQIFIALSGKIIKRVTDSLRVVLRDKKKYTDDHRLSITERYQAFIKWLVDFCFDSLYCNAYFGSYTLILSTIKLIIAHIPCQIENMEIFPIDSLLSRKQCYDSILSCLNDSFEENKALALELLFKLPNNVDFVNTENLRLFESIANELVASVNPAHSLTCQYIFRLCLGLEARISGQSRNRLLLKKLHNLSDLVDEGVRETQEDFVVALKHNAIYPKLTCIRALLSEIDMSEIEEDRDSWSELANRIVVASIEACKAVSTIVCNLNPETIGHLPMDQKPIDAVTLTELLKLSPRMSKDDLNTITSQLLLISGWKTIKECSLSLGSLCTRLWWPEGGLPKKGQDYPGSQSTKSILESDDVVKVIQFFEHYLKNLRHRGAFEQAYTGFIMVTKRIWNDKQFKLMLVKTLTQILNDFRGDAMDDQKAEYLKAYVTRRSAGLPFIVQAILISEKPQETDTLDYVMNCLYEILESENSEIYQKIHCLNILNGLTKEANLSEKMMRYVGKTFAITLDALASNSFPVRNCANMLLKATVDRTFGTNRSKHTIHHKNLMTFGKFFLECPSLQGKMLEHLRRCTGQTDVSYAAIHGVFIILSRLRANQAPSDQFKPTKELIGPFIGPLLELTQNCEDFKIVEIAMQLVARLDRILSPENEFIVGEETLLRSWSELKQVTPKFVHQILFQKNILYELYQSKMDMDDVKTSEVELSSIQKRVEHYQRTFEWQLDYNYSFFLINQILVLMEKCVVLLATDVDNLDPMMQFWGHLQDFAYDVIAPFADPERTCQKEYIGRAASDPLFEECIFKSVVFLTSTYMDSRMPDFVFSKITKIKTLEATQKGVQANQLPVYSDALQGALLRHVRQRLCEPYRDTIFEKIMDKLDIDSTATFCTPVDRMKNPRISSQERAQLHNWYGFSYIGHQLLSLRVSLREFRNLNELSKFEEFQRAPLKFSPNLSNTARAVELVTIAYQIRVVHQSSELPYMWDLNLHDIEKIMITLCDMLRDLPDCDIKCLAIKYSGLIIERVFLDQQSHLNMMTESILCNLNRLTSIFDELSDGNHSIKIRGAICEAIQGCALPKSSWNDRHQQMLFIKHIYSAIIKLSQDEDCDIRNSCHTLIRKYICRNRVTQGSPLIDLINVAGLEIFEPEEGPEFFDLLMKFIFNHGKSHSISATSDKEGLFDKTKLNTFADHVAVTGGVVNSLRNFLDLYDQLIDLNRLNFSSDILFEFQTYVGNSEEKGTSNEDGDYSWRKRKSRTGKMIPSEPIYSPNNDQLVAGFIEQILASLDYFRQGYISMLTDTAYTYHELSLYKRVALIAIVRDCTYHRVENFHKVAEIREKLAKIIENSCATTLLVKTLDLIRDSNIETRTD